MGGIVIATVELFGGLAYENPEIQKSIDETFVNQQLEVEVEANFHTQKSENHRIELKDLAHFERPCGEHEARRSRVGLPRWCISFGAHGGSGPTVWLNATVEVRDSGCRAGF